MINFIIYLLKIKIESQHNIEKNANLFQPQVVLLLSIYLELKKYGFNHFDGGDISKELLNQIPANLYNELEQIDLNKNILKKDDFYDVVMCVGTFTFAHVKAHALDEFIRITKKNGFICFTINEAIYIDYGFKSKIDSLVDNNIIKEIEFFKSKYLASKDVNAWLGLYKIL